jgi:precorrin-4/cobalt-precorrin-4 C11-methyltransferase
LALHLSIHMLDEVVAALVPHYGADCPVAVVWRASWPDEQILLGTLAGIGAMMEAKIDRTALILVGRVLGAEEFARSRLYAQDYDRRYRPTGANPRFPETA